MDDTRIFGIRLGDLWVRLRDGRWKGEIGIEIVKVRGREGAREGVEAKDRSRKGR